MKITNQEEFRAFLALPTAERAKLEQIELNAEGLLLVMFKLHNHLLQPFYTALSQCKALDAIQLNPILIPLAEEEDGQFLMLLEAILQQKPLLRTIHLPWGHLPNLGLTELQAFCSALSQCKALETIDLRCNRLETLDNARLSVLGNALQQCPALQILDLSNNFSSRLEPDKFETLYASLEKCKTLCHIIGIEQFNPAQRERLNRLVEQHSADLLLEKAQNQLDWLLYDSKKQIVDFTATDTGDFEIDRLCQGHDTIYRTLIPEGRQKRTLVLEDFTAKQWSAEKKSEVKQKLLSLISQGFDVYLYQPPKSSAPTQAPLLKLSVENIHLIDSPEFEIPLVKKEAINQLMKTINIPADQIAHLDTTHLKELLGDNLPGITIQELAQSGYPFGLLKDYLKTADPEIPIFNTLYTDTPEDFSNYFKTLQELQQFFTIKTRVVDVKKNKKKDDEKDDDNFETLLQKHASTLKTLSLKDQGLSFSAPYLKKLRELHLQRTKISHEDFVLILRNNDRLERLHLESIYSPVSTQTQNLLTTPLTLKSLKNLVLFNIPKDLQNFILSATEKLNELTILRMTQPKATISLGDISQYKLQDLEELGLGFKLSIERKEFSAILEKTPHLKTLSLQCTYNLDIQPEDIPEGALINLETLCVDTSIIDMQALAAIFERSVKLKSLMISKPGKKPFAINIIPDSILTNLEKANFTGFPLNPDEIQTLLKKMIHLRDLSLNAINFSKLTPEHFPVEILKNLTKCDMDYSEASLSVCQHILQHATQLNEEQTGKIKKAIEEKQLERIKRATAAEEQSHQSSSAASDSAASGQPGGTNVNVFSANTGSNMVDADTRHDAPKEYTARQIFKGINCPDPSDRLYRLKIYDTVTVIEDSPNRPFALSNQPPNDSTLVPPDPPIQDLAPNLEIKQETEFKYYRGKPPPMVIRHDSWTPLPSLSPQEILTHARVRSDKGDLNSKDYKIRYSPKDNLYYIKSEIAGAHRVEIEFLLKKPARPVSVDMPTEINALVKKYKAYPTNPPNGGKLTLSDVPTGTEVLKALQTQNIGACRHRTIAFKKEVEALLGSEYPVRITDSVSHSFVEVCAKSGDWVRFDLGGYPANTVLFDEHGKPVPESAQIETEADSTAEAEADAAASVHTQQEVKLGLEHKATRESKNQEGKETKEDKVDFVNTEIIREQDLEGNPFKIWESHTKIPTQETLPAYILQIAQGKSPITSGPIIQGAPLKKILVKFDSEAETEAFRLLVQKQMIDSGKEVYYINSPEDLICSAPWTERNLNTNKGVLRQAHYPPGDKLRRFLKAKHQNPVLVVNWSNFKAADIVKFNSLLDKKRKADGVEVPENTLIVGLHTKKPGAYNGEDFFSRSGVVVTFPFNHGELIAEAEKKDLLESRYTATRPDTTTAPLEQKTDPQERIVIDLYDSPSWKSLLLGTWCLKGKELIFEQGPLAAALEEAQKTGKTIELKNAPWRLEEFRVFWQQARLHQKINIYGQEIAFPPHFKVHATEGYAWETLLKLENVNWTSGLSEAKSADAEMHILNPSTFNHYFKNYISIAGDLISRAPGWIENAVPKAKRGQPMAANQQGSLAVLLTRELSQHQWGQLLAFAKQHRVKLNIRVAPGVSLPDSFPESLKASFNTAPPVSLETKLEKKAETTLETKTTASLESKIRLDTLEKGKGHVLFTEDIDYAIAALKDSYPKDAYPRLGAINIIDISECEARHLLVSRTPRFNKNTLDYKFIQTIGSVWAALAAGETVVLKGQFKPELIDALAPLCSNDPHFWLNGKRLKFPGKLVLVTDNQASTLKNFSFASSTTVPSAKTTEELFALLKSDTERRYLGKFSAAKINAAIEALKKIVGAEKHPFVKLQSLVEHQLCSPSENPEHNWQGLYTLNEAEKKMTDEKISVDETTEEQSTAFEQKRLAQINHALKFRPFVFIAGSTGAGKSTFIKQVLAKQPDYKVFFENQLHTWAKDKTPGVTKTLFIDEANIDKGNFSAFEGLFETPPKILIGSTSYTLTEQHKVIFAGNPLSYGARKMPTLFARRGGSIIFSPLQPSYLYSRVLKPILSNPVAGLEQKTAGEKPPPLLTEAEQKIVGEKLLQVYQYIARLPSEHILISPRELQMMALLVLKKYQHMPPPPLDACIAYAVHTLGTGVVPENHQANFLQWCESTGFKKSLLPAAASGPAPFRPPGEAESSTFVVTESRKAAYNQICDFLSIRTLRQADTANEAFKYAGLGGMILEGEPGVGKSHFVVDTLISQGFKEKQWEPSDPEAEQPVIQRHQTATQISKPKTPATRWQQDNTGHWYKLEAQAATQKGSLIRQLQQKIPPLSVPPIPPAPLETPPQASPQKIFYLMPVSMPLEEKKKLLLQAFDEGAVVVIDEINSSSLMEELLNDLLMGIYAGRRPKHPGFMIIGTQNPISMAGRIAATAAFDRRFSKLIFVPYISLEMKEILEKKGLEVIEINTLVEQYRKARLYAIQNNKKPIPTFRDVLQIVDFKIEALQRKRVDEKTKVAETTAAQETPVSDTKAAQEASVDGVVVMHLPETGNKSVYKK